MCVGQEKASHDSMISLGRDGLIELAAERIEHENRFPGFQRENFDRTAVRSDGEYIWVTFGASVRYAPRNTSIIFAITVFVYGQEGYGYAELSNPEDAGVPTVVFGGYREGETDLAELLDRIGFPDGAPDGVTIAITEGLTHYEIEEMSEHSASIYKLSKLTWKLYDEVHEDLAIDEEDQTTLIR